MSQATTYNVKTNREDLSKAYYLTFPDQFPLQNLIPMGAKPISQLHEWTIDDGYVQNFAGEEQGSDVSSYNNYEANLQRVGNRVQRLTTPWKVTIEQTHQSTAGINDHVAHAQATALVTHKRAIERSFGSDQDMKGGTQAQSRGLGDAIDSGGPADVPVDYRTPSGAISNTNPTSAGFTSSTISNVLQTLYEKSGKDSSQFIFCVGRLLYSAIEQLSISKDLKEAAYRYTSASDKNEINTKVTRILGNFGIIDVIPSTELGWVSGAKTVTDVTRKRGYIFMPEKLQQSWQLAAESVTQEDSGGGPRGFIRSLFTLVWGDPRCMGKFNAS